MPIKGVSKENGSKFPERHCCGWRHVFVESVCDNDHKFKQGQERQWWVCRFWARPWTNSLMPFKNFPHQKNVMFVFPSLLCRWGKLDSEAKLFVASNISGCRRSFYYKETQKRNVLNTVICFFLIWLSPGKWSKTAGHVRAWFSLWLPSLHLLGRSSPKEQRSLIASKWWGPDLNQGLCDSKVWC